MRRVGTTALATAALGLLWPAAASAVTAATGTITGSAGSYVLTVENTGTDAIQCMRFSAAAGVTITAVSAPATLESPGQFAAMTPIAPGAGTNFSFTTSAAYPDNGGGTLNVSSTCAVGSDVSSQVSGPAPPAGNAPGPQPCVCSTLTAALSHPAIRALHGRHLSIDLDWTLTCAAGDGNGCSGVVKVTTSPGLKDVKFLNPVNRTVSCAGPCAKPTTGTTQIDWLLSKRLRPLSAASTAKRRRHRQPYPPLRVQLDFFCVDATGTQKPAGRRIMTLRFDRSGQVDRKKSDFAGTVAPQPK